VSTPPARPTETRSSCRRCHPFEQRKLWLLNARYASSRIRHRLAQIAADGSTKIIVRTVPVIRAERASGRVPVGCATVVVAWIRHLRGQGAPVSDPGAEAYLALVDADDETAVRSVLDRLDPAGEVASGLGSDDDLVQAVLVRCPRWSRTSGDRRRRRGELR